MSVVVADSRNQYGHYLCSADSPPTVTTPMVRLITHNLLACHVKNCTSNNFPLGFKDVQIELHEAEFNADFLRGFMPKIEWGALIEAAKEVCCLYILYLAGAVQLMVVGIAWGYVFACRTARYDGRRIFTKTTSCFARGASPVSAPSSYIL